MAHCDFADIVLESGGYLAEFSSANGSGILPPAPPCFVDKNAVHGKTLKNDEFFRVFCCFYGKNATFVLRQNRFRLYAVF